MAHRYEIWLPGHVTRDLDELARRLRVDPRVLARELIESGIREQRFYKPPPRSTTSPNQETKP